MGGPYPIFIYLLDAFIPEGHPIPNALSRMGMGWHRGPTAGFVADPNNLPRILAPLLVQNQKLSFNFVFHTRMLYLLQNLVSHPNGKARIEP